MDKAKKYDGLVENGSEFWSWASHKHIFSGLRTLTLSMVCVSGALLMNEGFT